MTKETLQQTDQDLSLYAAGLTLLTTKKSYLILPTPTIINAQTILSGPTISNHSCLFIYCKRL